MSKPTIEALKEGARLALLLTVSWIITGAIAYTTDLPETEFTILLVFILRMIDKYLYKSRDYKLTQF